MARKSLDAGFTGDITNRDRPTAKARKAVDRVRDEAGMVAAHAADHPAATGSALIAVGLAGLAVGYLLGSASVPRDHSWRH
ncbi:hypothetical protein [Neorhizobium sp. JUb45]|uniref:hypothetical protein n=1 Tax=unclassified Neorhizobium TaxID=2629175 RepID=UPI00104B5344|nr:hypothetical protein [Neorhizobium sp. JUb45]TCR01829.1 hypothetical protein EDF70_104102 [Neorhizobium sp. JUb45]